MAAGSPDSRLPMTLSGVLRLKAELRHLKTVERGKNVRDIEEARAHGDLSENAEYHAAKEKQGQLDGRMRFLEDAIARAEVIDVAKFSGDKVKFGATVTLADEDTGNRVKYRIVGELEADLKLSRISVTSPFARAMMGREVGDAVQVQAPGGAREYEILAVEFLDEPPSATEPPDEPPSATEPPDEPPSATELPDEPSVSSAAESR